MADATSWAPVDLAPILSGDHVAEQPEHLRRTDGVALLYPNKQHSAYGEPESCKSWLADRAVAAELKAGMHVVVIDFEDDAPTWIERTRSLGVSVERVSALLHYVRPEEAVSDAGWAELAPVLERSTLVVIDGTNEGMSLHGLNPLDNSDIAMWMRIVPRRCQSYGAAVLNIDHVTRTRKAGGATQSAARPSSPRSTSRTRCGSSSHSHDAATGWWR